MRYEISCFVQENIAASLNDSEAVKMCVGRIEEYFSSIGIGFTIELRDLKSGALNHHAARANVESDCAGTARQPLV